jgi:uncharacterized RDD family membrane protein YckC
LQLPRDSRQRDKKTVKLAVISYVGNAAVIFGYFYWLNPMGSLIYFAWFTLGWALFFARLPRVADLVEWVRLLKKRIKGSK